MLLSVLLDNIITILSDPSNTWTDLSVSTYPARFALNPYTQNDNVSNGVYVVPGPIEYDLSNLRRQKQNSKKVKYVAISLCSTLPRESVPVWDVGNPILIKKLLDFREDIDRIIIESDLSQHIVEIEAEPPDDLKAGNSYFIANTVFGFNLCD